MAGDTSNPRLWVGADLYTAPISSLAPTSPTTPLDAAWLPVGLLSEDGATETHDEDSADFYAWGGILIRTQRSKFKRSIKVTCLEDNLTVFGLVNPGSSATTTGGVTTRVIKNPAPNKVAFVLDLADGGIHKRRYIPTGEVTAVDDITLSDSDLAAYALTLTIYPDADGVLYQDITDDPQASVSVGGE